MADGLIPGLVCPEWDGDASDQRNIALLMALVLFQQPRVIVEAGTYKGHTALHLAGTLRANKLPGHIWTADTEDRGQFSAIEAAGLSGYVSVWLGGFDGMLPLVPKPIDLAYIDASHVDDPYMRLRHISMVYDNLAVGGLIVVDDVNARIGDWSGVEAIRNMAHLYLDGARGLAVFQKR